MGEKLKNNQFLAINVIKVVFSSVTLYMMLRPSFKNLYNEWLQDLP